MLREGVVVAIDTSLSSQRGDIGRVGVDEFVPFKGKLLQKYCRILIDELTKRRIASLPAVNNIGVYIDAIIALRGTFVSKNGSPAEMGFNINSMRRYQIDQPLKAFAFSARVSHGLNHRQK